VPIIKKRKFFVLDQNPYSSNCPATIFVDIPRFKNREIKKNDNVIKPRPPICIKHKMMHFPKKVNADIGTTFNPVTHVVDVVVKIMFNNEISVVREIGSESRIEPIVITNKKENNKILPGENFVACGCNILPLFFCGLLTPFV